MVSWPLDDDAAERVCFSFMKGPGFMLLLWLYFVVDSETGAWPTASICIVARVVCCHNTGSSETIRKQKHQRHLDVGLY